MENKIKSVLLKHRTTHTTGWYWLPASDDWIKLLSDEIAAGLKEGGE